MNLPTFASATFLALATACAATGQAPRAATAAPGAATARPDPDGGAASTLVKFGMLAISVAAAGALLSVAMTDDRTVDY